MLKREVDGYHECEIGIERDLIDNVLVEMILIS